MTLCGGGLISYLQSLQAIRATSEDVVQARAPVSSLALQE